MQDTINQFIQAMREADCAPHKAADVIADGKDHFIQLAGDKKKDRLGYYLTIKPDGFAYGNFRRFDSGLSGKWDSGSSQVKTMSPEEIRAHKKRIKEIEEERDRALSDAHAVAVAKAKDVWGKSVEASPDHPYLVKKGIAPEGIRQAGDLLIIPEFGPDGKINSYQTIDHNGVKKYQYGAKRNGLFCPLAQKSDSRELIILCEGYSTGRSIRMAMPDTPVLCALDAGNLLAVGDYIRNKYPDSYIIVAADGDQWTVGYKYRKSVPEDYKDLSGQAPQWNEWRESGWLENRGYDSAKVTASKIKGSAIDPGFATDDQYKRTDFNDLHLAEGLDAVKNRILLAKAEKVPLGSKDIGDSLPISVDVQTEGDDFFDWKARLICDKNGSLQKGSTMNVNLYMEYHEQLVDIFRFDQFANQIVVARQPPWQGSQFEVRLMRDTDITEATCHLETVGMMTDMNKVFKIIETVANKRAFHPAREYFNALSWDGEERLKSWLFTYFGANNEPFDYLAFIGKKWMTAAVKRVFEPGCKFDHILVIEGSQGTGKSTALLELSTFGRDKQKSYFTDSIKISGIQNKDTISTIQGSLIVELAELVGFSKKDDAEIKQWITLRKDVCRPAYGRLVQDFPRQFVLAATTNDYEYLKDPTGNRRYWPFKSDSVEIELIKKDREQLWAEAVHLYKSGLYIGPTHEEMVMAEREQAKRMTSDVWEDDVIGTMQNMIAMGNRPIKTDELMKEMGMELRERDARSQRRIAGILTAGGYENTVKAVNGKSARGWVKKA